MKQENIHPRVHRHATSPQERTPRQRSLNRRGSAHCIDCPPRAIRSAQTYTPAIPTGRQCPRGATRLRQTPTSCPNPTSKLFLCVPCVLSRLFLIRRNLVGFTWITPASCDRGTTNGTPSPSAVLTPSPTKAAAPGPMENAPFEPLPENRKSPKPPAQIRRHSNFSISAFSFSAFSYPALASANRLATLSLP